MYFGVTVTSVSPRVPSGTTVVALTHGHSPGLWQVGIAVITSRPCRGRMRAVPLSPPSSAHAGSRVVLHRESSIGRSCGGLNGRDCDSSLSERHSPSSWSWRFVSAAMSLRGPALSLRYRCDIAALSPRDRGRSDDAVDWCAIVIAGAPMMLLSGARSLPVRYWCGVEAAVDLCAARCFAGAPLYLKER